MTPTWSIFCGSFVELLNFCVAKTFFLKFSITLMLISPSLRNLSRKLSGSSDVNAPLCNHEVFGPSEGRDGDIGGKNNEQLVKHLINIHNGENCLGTVIDKKKG